MTYLSVVFIWTKWVVHLKVDDSKSPHITLFTIFLRANVAQVFAQGHCIFIHNCRCNINQVLLYKETLAYDLC